MNVTVCWNPTKASDSHQVGTWLSQSSGRSLLESRQERWNCTWQITQGRRKLVLLQTQPSDRLHNFKFNQGGQCKTRKPFSLLSIWILLDASTSHILSLPLTCSSGFKLRLYLSPLKPTKPLNCSQSMRDGRHGVWLVCDAAIMKSNRRQKAV